MSRHLKKFKLEIAGKALFRAILERHIDFLDLLNREWIYAYPYGSYIPELDISILIYEYMASRTMSSTGFITGIHRKSWLQPRIQWLNRKGGCTVDFALHLLLPSLRCMHVILYPWQAALLQNAFHYLQHKDDLQPSPSFIIYDTPSQPALCRHSSKK